MEVIKKTRKTKKRRHRNESATQEDNCEDRKTVKNLAFKDIIFSNIKKTQVVQTEISCIHENTELLTEKDEKIKNLTERLHSMTTKLYESKNANTILKQDFQKAQKLLCSEVGENVTVAGLSTEPGGWRGRAEQIQQLQQKVSELQLRASESDGLGRRSLERKSSSSVRLFDRERKQQVENLTKALKDSEASFDDCKKKLEAAKARISVLEHELNSAKKTITCLNDKTSHDNQLIDILHKQLEEADARSETREIEIKRQTDKYEREMVLLKSELEASQLHIKNFKNEIEEREDELNNLRCQSKAMIDQSKRTCREISIESPRSSIREAHEQIAKGIAAEAERERLLELVALLNQRLDKERGDYEQLSESFKRERSRGAKLEIKLQKLELERAAMTRAKNGSYRFRATKPNLTATATDNLSDLEDIRLKFELLQEECLTLKTRLATVQKDKAADLATFKKMLDQTRKIFRDACRGKLPAM
ncbi:coiled-coil domain-containing protein 13-like [Phymastichus coffea]|uniref:coiled-coil domain-containing protein 13-like n=1 Tax=Phymastichus coffea TaxID=108790 RepID=UPI00273C407B|nr:coiled-coil domain-containing protein 13-like [Phymastichus coffea]